MLTGNILTTDGWIHGTIEYENGRITSLEGERVDPSTNDAPYILPGFIDLHVHGGGGADIMEGGNAFETITRTHARYGTTSLLATTMTAPRDELMRVVAGSATTREVPRARRRARARRASGRPVHQPRQARRAAGRRRRRRDGRSAEVSVASRRSAWSRSRRKSPATWRSSPRLAARGVRVQTRPYARHLRRRRRRAQARRARFHASVQRHDAAASPRSGHRRRGARARRIRRTDSGPAARASGRDPRGAARDSASVCASPTAPRPPACPTANTASAAST